jgi:hypothetical protein
MVFDTVSDAVSISQPVYSGHEYYHLGRIRTKTADALLETVASVVAAVMVTKKITRNELFDRYDVKLWSYDDNLFRFALPSIAAMACLFAAYRAVEILRSAF